MAKKTEKLIRWGWNENVTAEEFILRLAPLVCDAMQTAQECDGDIWLSQYRKLNLAASRLTDAVGSIRKGEAE